MVFSEELLILASCLLRPMSSLLSFAVNKNDFVSFCQIEFKVVTFGPFNDMA